MLRIQPGKVYHRQKPLARVFVQLFQSEMGKDPVLPHHGNQIRRYAHHQKVEQRYQALERDPVLLRICLDKLEPHPAARKVIERIPAVRAFRVQHRNCGRKVILGKMMVADNDIYALAGRIADLVVGLDPAVQGDYQAEPVVGGPVYSLVRHPVSFIIPVWHIKIHIAGESLQKRIDKRHSRGPIDIIIPIDQYLLSRPDGRLHPFHGLVHILHQERVVEIVETRPEKRPRFLKGPDASLHKQLRQDRVDAKFGRESRHCLPIGDILQYPFLFLSHSLQIYAEAESNASLLAIAEA